MRRRELRLWMWAVALLAIYSTLTLFISAWELNSTIDENIYRVAGLQYLKFREFSINFEHPPFSKWWGASLPYLLAKTDSVFWYRVPHILLFLSVGLLVCFLLWKHVSPLSGVFWSLLYFLCPNTKAMASLHVNDFDVAAWLILMVAILYAFARKRDHANAPMCFAGLSLALSLNSKFTGLFILPFLGLWFFLVRRAHKNWKKELGFLSLGIFLGFLISYLGNFSEILWYGKGIDAQRLHDRVATHPSSLFGEIRSTGFWYYYLVCFFSKTPLMVLVLLPFGLYSGIKRDKTMLWLCAIPALFLLIYLSRLNVQTGLRYFLPGILLIYFIAACGLAKFHQVLGNQGSWVIIIMFSGLWILDQRTLATGSYLSYFNSLAPTPTTRKFTDANNDWGQDIPNRLKKELPYLIIHVNSLIESELKTKDLQSRIYVYAGANDLIGFWSVRAKKLNSYEPIKIIGAYEIFELSVAQAIELAQSPARP